MNRVTPTRYQLEEAPAGAMRFLAGLHVSLEEGRTSSTVTIIRTGSFYHPKHGRFEVNRELLDGMVRNFEARTYGQDIFIDVAHEPQKGATGEIKRLFIEGNRLRALVEWTPYGVEAIKERGFRYLSADYWDDWKDNEEGNNHGPLLAGAGLVTRPHIKRLDPVTLTEDDSGIPTLIHPELSTSLQEEARIEMNKHLENLRKQLEAKKLSEKAITAILKVAEAQMKTLGEDDAAMADVAKQLAEAGDAVAEQIAAGNHDIKITLTPAGTGKTLGEDDINRIMDERAEASAKKLADEKSVIDGHRRLLAETINGTEGFSDELRKELIEGSEGLITAGMTETQVKKLAEHQIGIGKRLSQQAASVALAGLGFAGAAGSPRISVDDSNSVKKLQETADRRMGILDLSDARRYARTGGKLLEENKALADKVLAMYDAEHAVQLREEHKMLAAGDGVVSDVTVPAVWERTVIREALYQLVGLQFADVGVDQFATSYMIPYSYRDTSGAGRNDTRRFEGQSISRAGVIQTAETAYNTPQKLAFEVSDELRYLTQARHLNWDSVTENQRNASRIIGEDIEQLLFNEQLRASDEYGAVAVSNEALTADVDGTNNVFPLANFPVVRPRSVYDLQGSQVGSTVNPVTVSLGGSGIDEYDGTGTQGAGNYYSLDYNQGEVRIVNEAGVLQTPANATALVVSYSYTSNVYAFDTDLGSAAAEDHWNTFLYRYGLRKAIIEDDRYHMANFGLMSGTVANQIEQAKQFAANFRRPGTELTQSGNVGVIKDVPNFKTTAPGLWMADQRIILGERGQTRFRVTKPWSLGELENQKDANGRFTGKKEAYGDQFVVVHTPTQLKAALTSMVLYSASTRAARAE